MSDPIRIWQFLEWKMRNWRELYLFYFIFFKVCGHRCMQLGVLKADTQVNPSRKLEQWSGPLIFILPSSTRTEPLKSTLAVSWMKFSSLHLPDRQRFVLRLRELLWVLWFYCPPDDCSHNSSAFAHTFNTHGHKKTQHSRQSAAWCYIFSPQLNFVHCVPLTRRRSNAIWNYIGFLIVAWRCLRSAVGDLVWFLKFSRDFNGVVS